MDRAAWKPHAKSMSLGRLATHLAEIPQWTVQVCTQDELDFAPPGAPPFQPKVFGSVAEVLATFDGHVKVARETIAQTTDAVFLGPWTLKQGGKPLFTSPKIAVLRSFVLSHAIHHRAQLTVYLRLLDVPVPAVYGPSADET
jgi:uncharacterized damage-inducible protein DinB